MHQKPDSAAQSASASVRSPRSRVRQRRRIAAFVCLPGALLGLSTLGAAQALGAFDQAAEPACPVALVTVPTRSSFTVTVLNGSGTNGMARAGAAALTRAGFRVAGARNAKEADWTDLPAVIGHGPAGLAQAQVVAAMIPGSRLADDGRAGTDVDVTVGTAFSTRLHEETTPERTGSATISGSGRSLAARRPEGGEQPWGHGEAGRAAL